MAEQWRVVSAGHAVFRGENLKVGAAVAPGVSDPNFRQGHQAPVPEVLPKSIFLDQLWHEKMRTDRSKTPLSLLLLEVSSQPQPQSDNLLRVIHALRLGLREIDSIGILRTDTLAVLLPDTSKADAILVADKIRADDDCPVTASTVATYPDALFDSLQPGLSPQEHIESGLFLGEPASRPVQSVLKRLIDIGGALTGLILLSPLMLATMAAIRLTSPGSTIFRQIRLGKDFKPFTFYKFRSMYSGADDSVHRDYLANLVSGNLDDAERDASGKVFYKLKSDSRVTRVGRFIRRTSIDELPQLVNVLKGEMSLVGPRPPIPYETENYRSWHLRRILEVKPGLTGLWQVEGRSQTTFDEMVRLDLRYASEWSVLLDLKLIFRTVGVVLDGRGAA